MSSRTVLKEKLHEAVKSVLPIALIVALLAFTIAPVPTDLMLSFVIGTALLILGLGLFSYGSEASVTRMGAHIGAKMTRSRNIPLILFLSFLLGVIVTVAEPDLQVLAVNVPHIDTFVLILAVSAGVGMFLLLSMLRILLGVQLRWLLLVFYLLIFVLASQADPAYLSVAFDSGGVTTGPMTAPFIISLGVGVAAIRSDQRAEEDSFGLVALCSVGPILAVLTLGFFYRSQGEEIAAAAVSSYADTVALGRDYLQAVPHYLREVTVALAPVALFFLLFQVLALKLRKRPFQRILLGLIYTYAGLVLFLTGVNVGFSSLGLLLGEELAIGETKMLIIPVVMLMGYFIVAAEPAVHVLNAQVEEISAGAVTKRSMHIALSVAIAGAMGLSMLRILYGIPILYFVLPGYLLALLLSFFVPQMFTAIAFDAGGVASGPMSATFMLPFAFGVCRAVGGNLLTDAFGIVALVALMPLITVQVMGVIAGIRARETKQEAIVPAAYADTDVIELW
ncbi:MAG: DUF1538 domain-containing protein [Lachnospiraceae bacterium]|nr:DUF1538 domain-containing protein [Lachnospiraceae bacterium]